MAFSILRVGELEGVLRWGWNYEKFRLGPQGAAREETSVTAEELEEGLGSTFWWAYRAMMGKVSLVLAGLMHWVESCPCHWDDSDVNGPDLTPAQRQAVMRCKYGIDSCPLRARRGPEVAMGGLHALVDRLMSQSLTELTHLVSHRLEGDQKHMIVSDFELCRKHVSFVLRLQLGSWGQLPLELVGMAHHDPGKQRQQMKACLGLFSQAQDTEALHPLCHDVLGHDSPVRREIEKVLEGAPVSEQPSLMKYLARWKFIMIAERFIEGCHAALKKHMRSAPHHGPAFVAWSTVSGVVAETLAVSDPHQILRPFAEACQHVRNPLLAAKALGFEHHPVVKELVRQLTPAGANRSGAQSIKEVIYHCDGPTLFLDHQIAASAVAPLAVAGRKPLMDHSGLMTKYAVELLEKKLCSGSILMIDLGEANDTTALRSLQDFMGISTRQQGLVEQALDDAPTVADDDLPLDLDEPLAPLREASPIELLTDRLLRLHPGLQKYRYCSIALAKLPPLAAYVAHRVSETTGEVVPANTMVVTVHLPVYLDTAKKEVVLSCEPGGYDREVDMLVLPALLWSQLRSVRIWQESSRSAYAPRITSVPHSKLPVLFKLCKVLVDAGAVEGGPEWTLDLRAGGGDYTGWPAVLETLKQEGIVRCGHEDVWRSSWQLTQHGLQQLMTCKVLTGQPALALLRRDEVAS